MNPICEKYKWLLQEFEILRSLAFPSHRYYFVKQMLLEIELIISSEEIIKVTREAIVNSK